MRVSAQKWGNSLAVRIPKSILINANIVEGSNIDLLLVGGNIILKPIPNKRKKLDEYLSMVTPDNIHSETQTGNVIGNEVW